MDHVANGKNVFRFEHLAHPGQQMGGWITTMAVNYDSSGFGHLLEVQGEVKYEGPVATSCNKGVSVRIYNMEEIEKYNTKDDVWIIVNGKVCDCTNYLEIHPGEIDSVIINVGADATEDSVVKVTKTLDWYYVSKLDASSAKSKTVGVAERETIRVTSFP